MSLYEPACFSGRALLVAPKLTFRAKGDELLQSEPHDFGTAETRLAKSGNSFDSNNNQDHIVIINHENVIVCLLPLKGDKEKKRLELLERKKENQRLLDEESAKMKGKSQKELGGGGKVTRAQIEEVLQAEQLKQEQLELKPKGQSIPDNVAVNHHLFPVRIKVYSHRNDSPGGSSGGEREQICS